MLFLECVILVLDFWKLSILFSTVAAPIYIPRNSIGGFPFLHILTGKKIQHPNVQSCAIYNGQANSLSLIRRIDKEDVVHTHTHTQILLSYRKNEFFPFAATGMDLEGTMLSKISQRRINTV